MVFTSCCFYLCFYTKFDFSPTLLADKLAPDPDQARLFLHLYAHAFLKSNVVDLTRIDPVLVYFFQTIDFNGIALAYHGTDWEYIRDTNKSQLLMRE